MLKFNKYKITEGFDMEKNSVWVVVDKDAMGVYVGAVSAMAVEMNSN